MRDCVVAGSGWSGQRMERNRFRQSEQRVPVSYTHLTLPTKAEV